MHLRLEVIRSREALAAIVPAWEGLAAHAIEANPFYEPWILLPALRARGDADLVCLAAWRRGRLVGLFPFERARRFKGLPVTALTSWRHSAYLLCTPLVRAEAMDDCIRALRNWAPEEASVLEFRYVPCDGAFYRALARTATTVLTASFDRALLVKEADPEAYLAEAASKRLRRQLRKTERDLHARGGFSCVVRAPGEELSEEIERFLALEASGWKGRSGGALAANEASLEFGRAVLHEAARRGRLHIVGIDCEGRAIARRVSILAGAGAYAFKTAYDEAYAQYSPGVYAEALCLREFQRLAGVQWMDSYTDPDNPIVNRLWKDRRAMQHVAIGAGAWGELWLSMLPLLRWAARRLKETERRAAPVRPAA